jgi:hypothetical protein
MSRFFYDILFIVIAKSSDLFTPRLGPLPASGARYKGIKDKTFMMKNHNEA